ncbi:MAG: glycosyltransferase family 4 protein [Bacteroidetes bacterium]|nr:glycosyltransferase family 4 protein [Bacteroidota bacterium]
METPKVIKPLKILFVINWLKKGGAERIVLEISKCLSKREGVKVLIVLIHPENEYKLLSNGLNIKNSESLVIPSFFRKSKVNLTNFINIVNDFNPDIIHSHLFESEIFSRWELFPKTLYVTHCHGNYTQFKKFSLSVLFNRTLLTNYYERFILFKKYRECNNHFIAVSNDTLSFLNKNLPKDLQQINLHPNAIDFYKFNQNNVNQDRNPQKRPVKLITVGSLIKKKNQIFLINVVDILIKKGFDVILDIFGVGEKKELLEKEIKKNKLGENIFLKGLVENIEDNYNSSDIYVHSSLSESFGLVMLEANAAGLPVVCLDGKGNRDIIKEGYNGYMIKKTEPVLFADKIIQLVSSPELYQNISANAVKFASGYDIQLYADKLIEYYHNLRLIN